jgi:hypothetical protein
MKRTVVLFGAGASIEYGAPSTFGLTDTIGRKVEADDYMKMSGGDAAYLKIRDTLSGYLSAVNFEQIYHCVHELIYSAPTPGAVDEIPTVTSTRVRLSIAEKMPILGAARRYGRKDFANKQRVFRR